MLIGRAAKPDNVPYQRIPWPKFDEPDPNNATKTRSRILVEVRRVPTSVAHEARARHLGDATKFEFEKRGGQTQKDAPTIQRTTFSNSAQHAYMLDVCAYALGDILLAPWAESGPNPDRPEFIFDDAETASKVWQLLNEDQRKKVGSLTAGSKVPLDGGFLRANKALREWLLSEDASLLSFVNAEADRLAVEVIRDEEGKG